MPQESEQHATVAVYTAIGLDPGYSLLWRLCETEREVAVAPRLSKITLLEGACSRVALAAAAAAAAARAKKKTNPPAVSARGAITTHARLAEC